MATRCGNGSTRMPEILDYVKVVLAQAIENFKMEVDSGNDDTIKMYEDAINRLNKRLKELEDLEATQWEKYTLEDMPKHVFDRLNAKVLAEKKEVLEALCAAQDSIPEPVDIEERIATFQTALDMLNDPHADVEKLNSTLKDCITEITYSRPGRTEGKLFNDAPFTAAIELKIPRKKKA